MTKAAASMSKAIKVSIGGKELTLRGENEEKIKKAVREVNLQIQQIQQSLPEQSTPTMSLLAALNLAERYIDAEDGRKSDSLLVTEELNKMSAYLERAWKTPL
ncbi:MAG: cell division protein ZapA [Ignavibacteria bacterium]|nr:cell division protein ZapA [Ignavibacteria bacterium]